MSVLDSSVVVKVSWAQLVDPSNWECGWVDKNCSDFSKVVNKKYEVITTNCIDPSVDSGLTIPITDKIIRSWFGET